MRSRLKIIGDCFLLIPLAVSLSTGCTTRLPVQEDSPLPTLTSPPTVLPTLPTDLSSAAYPVRYFHSSEGISLEPPLGWQVFELKGASILAEAVDPDTGAVITLAKATSSFASQISDVNLAYVKEWLGEAEVEIMLDEPFRVEDRLEGWLRMGRLMQNGDEIVESDRWTLVTVSDGDSILHLSMLTDDNGAEIHSDVFLTTVQSLHLEPSLPLEFPRNNALILASGEPTTLDPALTHSGGAGLMGDLFSGLVVLDAEMQVQPALAERWEVSSDGTVYTFYLHSEARFHNGRPVKAEDVVVSWERAAHPDTGSETVLLYMGDIVGLKDYHEGNVSRIEGLAILDAHTLEVRIDAPKPYFLAKLTYPVSWIVDRYNVGMPNWEDHPNGTGPFRHYQHIDEEIFILERNPYYYGEQPQIEYVVYLMYAGYTQRLYQLDEVDLAGLSRDQLDRAKDPNDGLFGNLFSETSLCTSYIVFNTSMPPFDDPLVRRAFVHAIDRERYVEAITNDEAVVGRGLLPPGMPGYSEDVSPPNFDPGLARQLLSESCYYDGSQETPEIVWTLGSSGGRYFSGAALLVDMWEEYLGIKIKVEGIEWQNFYEQIDEGNYGHLLSWGWCADYPDPENFLDLLFHSRSSHNHAYYDDPTYDALIEQARTETDIEIRLTLYQQAEQHLLDDAPALFLSHSAPSYGVWKSHIHGYIPSPIGVPQHYQMWIER